MWVAGPGSALALGTPDVAKCRRLSDQEKMFWGMGVIEAGPE
jgi:hypothetical protein